MTQSSAYPHLSTFDRNTPDSLCPLPGTSGPGLFLSSPRISATQLSFTHRLKDQVNLHDDRLILWPLDFKFPVQTGLRMNLTFSALHGRRKTGSLPPIFLCPTTAL